MKIKLNWLRLKNFKGVKDFTLTANGNSCTVYGENGAGKTTTFDAFLWLLFNKDSTDRTSFKVKPQDDQGNDIHHLQTEVETELLVDGNPLKLRKMQEEKWTKKRGSATVELTGNTISYWWDEVPVKESEYKQRIGQLIDENIFRMITNPMYFNTKLSWQDRRKILLEICGDMTDEDVIASDKSLSKLTEILSGRSIEDYKKVLADKIKRLEKERNDIPPRIDELTLSLPQTQKDYSAVEAELQSYRDILAGIELDMTNATNAVGAFRKKQQELYGLRGKLEAVKKRIDSEAYAGRNALVNEKSRLQGEKYMLEAQRNDTARQIPIAERSLESKELELKRLREEWLSLKEKLAKIQAQEFVKPSEEEFCCPTCGQSLPEDMQNKKADELTKKFIENKIADTARVVRVLEDNKELGLSLKQETENLKACIESYQKNVKESDEKIKDTDNRISEIDQILSNPVQEPDYSADKEYFELSAKTQAMQSELDKPIEDTTASLLQNKREIQQKIDSCNAILNSKTVAENTKKRIEELKAEEKRVAALITELEGHKYLLEQFVVKKVNLLEDSINSRFKFVKFKLFDVQINGGIAECCEALVNTNGCYVPFADANHAGKTNAGIDCINALGAFYSVTAPIFIDFRESVSRIIGTDSQVINLFKNEADKVLRVEVEA